MNGLLRLIIFLALIAVLVFPASVSRPDSTSAGEPSPAASPQAAAAPRPAPGAARPSTPIYTCSIINTYPHDPQAFTQGLVVDDGILYESTGLLGRSSVRKVDLKTGAVLQIHRLPGQLFGEGITIFGERLIQLTWQSAVGLIYDKRSFRLLEEFRYHGEGWGLTHDGTRLIMSDGTSTLRFLDPETQRETGRVVVKDGTRPIERLNELEFVKGEVFANVWLTDRIAIVAPATGRVTAWLDLTGIRGAAREGEDVLNGIAYDAAGDRLFVTGKLWSRLFEIRVRR